MVSTEEIAKAFKGMIQESVDRVLQSSKSIDHEELQKVFIRRVAGELLKISNPELYKKV